MVHKSFNGSDRSYISLTKKEIHRMAADADFPAKRLGEIDIIVAEISSNLIKHGKEGELLAGITKTEHQEYLEIIALDNGPGMHDTQRMIEDGVSTTGTLGQGLGAIKRLSDNFELYSIRDWGTILLSRIYKRKPATMHPSDVSFRSVVVAKTGEEYCGDGCLMIRKGNVLKVFLGDGLGHGIEANKAVTAAMEVFSNSNEQSPMEMIREMHNEIKKTRGLVASVAFLDLNAKTGRICGVGNIAGKSFSAANVKNHISYNGIIGLNIPTTMKDQELLTGDTNQYLVLCSDGIRSRWEISKYPGVFKHDLSVLAAAIYKDFSRKTDDMSVVVGKIN
jgi:anti-sigma regulatory factor (Ser/Thr protein kinase)